MEELSISMVVITVPELIIRKSITETSHLLALNIQKLKNINKEKFLLIMDLVLKKILYKMYTDLTLKDQKKISSNGWTTKHF